ncbi:MAG: RNA-binding S4 domain-containing protein, partial [bacterium]
RLPFLLKMQRYLRRLPTSEPSACNGFVSVNGLKESRKRRKLSVGDQIQIRAPRLKVHLKLVEKSDTTDEPA